MRDPLIQVADATLPIPHLAEINSLYRRHGLFRTEYSGTMLREHYGLPWPASVFDDPAWSAELRESVAGV